MAASPSIARQGRTQAVPRLSLGLDTKEVVRLITQARHPTRHRHHLRRAPVVLQPLGPAACPWRMDPLVTEAVKRQEEALTLSPPPPQSQRKHVRTHTRARERVTLLQSSKLNIKSSRFLSPRLENRPHKFRQGRDKGEEKKMEAKMQSKLHLAAEFGFFCCCFST